MVRRDPRPPVLARDAQPAEQIGQRLVLRQLEAHDARLERPREPRAPARRGGAARLRPPAGPPGRRAARSAAAGADARPRRDGRRRARSLGRSGAPGARRAHRATGLSVSPSWRIVGRAAPECDRNRRCISRPSAGSSPRRDRSNPRATAAGTCEACPHRCRSAHRGARRSSTFDLGDARADPRHAGGALRARPGRAGDRARRELAAPGEGGRRTCAAAGEGDAGSRGGGARRAGARPRRARAEGGRSRPSRISGAR